MIDLTKPVQTRDGNKVEILHSDPRCAPYSIVGIVVRDDGSRCYRTWTREGHHTHTPIVDSGLDLVNAPEPVQERTAWVNVYENGDCGTLHGSREDANDLADAHRIACVPVVIRFRRGEGLEEGK